MSRVAVLGLGVMGREMAARLIAAGHRLSVFNRTAEKAAALAELGARIADSPAEAANGAEFVISIVADDEASGAVWLGGEGVLAGAPAAGAVMIESSTLSQAWVRELAGRVEATGFDFLDCPVTGGPDGARAGTLTMLIGGAEPIVDRAWPVLRAYAARKIRFGDIGAGTAYKVMVNLMGAVQGAALAEGLALAESAGLDLQTVRDALVSGAVASPHVKYLTDRILLGDHDDVYFSLDLRWKDAKYGLLLASGLGQEMAVSKAAQRLYETARAETSGDSNESVVIEVLRCRPGGS